MTKNKLAVENLYLWGAVALLLALYLLPWSSHRSTSLTLQAYDLAEWTSLHPEVHNGQMPLLVTALLRFPLVCLGGLLALNPLQDKRWLGGLITVVFALALLPPASFINQLDNSNYAQQFSLSITVLLLGSLMQIPAIASHRELITPLIIALMAGVALAGGLQALLLLQGFQLNVQAGIGWLLFITFSLFLTALMLIRLSTQRRNTP